MQIRGGVASVKKALLAISCCLQDCKLGERTPGQMSSRGVSHDILKYSILNSNSNSPTFSGNAVDYHPVVHSLSEDIDRKLSMDEDSTLKNVVFRLLCSNASAGGVIGKGANLVKSLEKETGACIKFSSLASGLSERVATISSLEVFHYTEFLLYIFYCHQCLSKFLVSSKLIFVIFAEPKSVTLSCTDCYYTCFYQICTGCP